MVRQKGWLTGAYAAKTGGALPFRSRPMAREQWSIAGCCRQTARSASRNFERISLPHHRSGWRQTEYQRPRFSSCHLGSEQSFLTIAAEACGSAGGGGVALEHAANATVTIAMISTRNKVLPFPPPDTAVGISAFSRCDCQADSGPDPPFAKNRRSL